MKILVTGGARSGKSTHALRLAEGLAPRRTFLATAEASDPEMVARIGRHQAERDASWTTVEEPLDVAPLLARDGVVLLDCLTLWTANLLFARGFEADLRPDLDALTRAIALAPNPLVIVTNEVGMGLVPDNALGRVFRDWAGWLAQDVARVVDEVVLMCAGLPLKIK